jgi:glycosyltransferase involved in cell wall biosynthesis
MDAFAKKSPVSVVRMPLAIVPRCGPQSSAEQPGKKPFTFLFAFDFQSLVERKNPMGTIRAFKTAFASREDVKLVIKGSHSEGHEGTLRDLAKVAEGANVQFLAQVLPEVELDALFAEADCYVSLHRGEGFGLTLAESMAMGKPVIATGYSGNLDFMNVNNSYLVKYRLIEIEEDHGPYKKGNLWADPDVEDAARHMRFVFENREEAKDIGARARRDIQENFSPQALAPLYLERLRAIKKNLRLSE